MGADFLGNLLKLLEKKMPGTKQSVRRQQLWQECQEHYNTHGVEDNVKSLEYRGSKSTIPPKVRCHAAGTRALIRFGHEMGPAHDPHIVNDAGCNRIVVGRR